MEQSQLLAHCGSAKITREELKVIPTPTGSLTHQPIPHYEIVGALVETLGFRQISVVREEYAVSSDGMKVFGVLDLETTFDGCRFAVGIRNANDKSMRLALTRMQRNFGPMRKQVEAWKGIRLADENAKLVIYKAFVEGELDVPKHLARRVHDLYFNPRVEQFAPRTTWSLSNAFTSAFKELDAIPQFKATAKLGSFLELTTGSSD